MASISPPQVSSNSESSEAVGHQVAPSPSPIPLSSHTQNDTSGVLSRFKSLTSNLNLNKFEFSLKKYTAAQDKIVFPPPSWFLDDDHDIATSTRGDHPTSLPQVQVQAQAHVNYPQAPPHPPEGAEAEAPEPAPEPETFAVKIRHLIDSLPLPTLPLGLTGTTKAPPQQESESDSAGEIPKDGRGPPIPSGVDATLVKLLSSESVMNGHEGAVGRDGDGKGKGGSYRQSVWSALERLRPSRAGGEGKEDVGDPSQSHQKGVMLYSPLEPTSDSTVELAESELEYVDPEDVESQGPTADAGKQGTGPGKHEPHPNTEKAQVPVWVPSTTKLSLYTTWWGYRLYLPPPVMAKLGSTNIKATARAAMMTTALKWLLTHIPLILVPPPLKPAVALLKRLTPLIGYIGVFVAWSWSRIAAYDEGNGVVLTATWLLPVALIPSSWDAGDIHGPPVRPPDEGGPGDSLRKGKKGRA